MKRFFVEDLGIFVPRLDDGIYRAYALWTVEARRRSDLKRYCVSHRPRAHGAMVRLRSHFRSSGRTGPSELSCGNSAARWMTRLADLERVARARRRLLERMVQALSGWWYRSGTSRLVAQDGFCVGGGAIFTVNEAGIELGRNQHAVVGARPPGCVAIKARGTQAKTEDNGAATAAKEAEPTTANCADEVVATTMSRRQSCWLPISETPSVLAAVGLRFGGRFGPRTDVLEEFQVGSAAQAETEFEKNLVRRPLLLQRHSSWRSR